MTGALVGGEIRCRVCALTQDEPIWGPDGQSPTYNLCPCCGCEVGYEDCLPEAIERHREKWIARNEWFDPTKRPTTWSKEEQLKNLPTFYFRVLPGLPGTGPSPVTFNATRAGAHAEGFVIQFTCASGKTWIGNFEPGFGGASGVMSVPGRSDQALVVANGRAYVVEPETSLLVRTIGEQLTDVLSLPDRETVILGNGLWFDCVGPDGLRWRTRRLSWDGMRDVAVEGPALRGRAFSPMDNDWSPFEVNVDTGEVTGGSYPPDLPQP